MAEPLSSERFAAALGSLKKSSNTEAMYVALHHWLSHTGALLGIESAAGGLDWAAEAKSIHQLVNHPLMAGVLNSPVGDELFDMQSYNDIVGIPHIKRDPGSSLVVKETLKLAEQYGKVNYDWPGMSEAWDEFMNTRVKRAYFRALNHVESVGDDNHKNFMRVLHHVVTGEVGSDLAEYEPDLMRMHDMLKLGSSEDLAINLYHLYNKIFDTELPEPPQSQSEPGEGEDQESDSEQNSGEGTGSGTGSGTGDGKGKGEGSDESDDGEQENQEDSDSSEEDDSGNGESGNTDKGNEDGNPKPKPQPKPQPKPGQNPGLPEKREQPKQKPGNSLGDSEPLDFKHQRLGAAVKRMASLAKPDAQATAQLNLGPGRKANVDPEKVVAIQNFKADVDSVLNNGNFPYTSFRIKQGAHQRTVYETYASYYSQEIHTAREIINEQFRTQFSTLRGMKSGKIDANRLYRVGLDKADVFRLDALDSLGKMDVMLVIDESGSMATRVAQHRKMPKFAGAEEPSYYGPDRFESLEGGELSTWNMHPSRAGLSTALSVILMEAVRDLPSIDLQVAGYGNTYLSHGTALDSAIQVAVALNDSKTVTTQNAFNGYVRHLGDKEYPYGIAQIDAFGGNADLEAIHYAVKTMKQSSKDHKAIIYLADGQTQGDTSAYKKLLQEAQEYGIYVFWFDLSGSDEPSHYSPFKMLDRAAVNNVDQMLEGLGEFLTNMVELTSTSSIV